MVNRLFSFMSQASGTALAAVVVGAMSLHAHNGGADAGISTQIDPVLGLFTSTGHPPSLFTSTGHPPSLFTSTGHPPA